MMTFWILALCTVPRSQSDDAGRLRELVERLRSDKAEERDEAERKLKDLGKAALPELTNAARSGDRELSERSRRLLKVIPVRTTLTPNLLAQIPGIDERLGLGDEHTWTTVFLEIAALLTVEQDPPEPADESTKGQGVNQRVKKAWKDTPEIGKVLPLKSEDVRVLVLPAIRQAKGPDEREKVFQVITERNLHSTVPDLRLLWKDSDEDLRCRIIAAVSALRATSALVEVRSALEDASPEVRASATRALGIVGGTEVIRNLVAKLGDPSATVREAAVVSLNLRDAKEGVPGIAKLLSDSNSGVRASSALALGLLEAKSAAPELIKALEDQDDQVRLYSMDALSKLNAKEAAPAATKLLADRSRWVRRSAFMALPGLKGSDAVPDLERGLDDGDSEIQRAALEGLWRLRGREAAPSFKKLLSVSDAELRLLAALVLCRSGVRDGVPTLLASPSNLVELNHVRRPTLCDRLSDRRYSGETSGSRRKIAEQIAQQGGLTIEWRMVRSGMEPEWVSSRCSLHDNGLTLLGALFAALHDTAYDVVLEDHQIRVLSHESALAFWKAWWAEEEGKK